MFSISSHAAPNLFYKITFQNGYFKNGYSLSESSFKEFGGVFTLNRLHDGRVTDVQILTQKTHSQMKMDFIRIVEALKLSDKTRKIASCANFVSIQTQTKEQSFCVDSLDGKDRDLYNKWLSQARRYLRRI